MNQTLPNNQLTHSALFHKPIRETLDAEIPKFYFPNGKPLDPTVQASNRTEINTIISDKGEVSEEMVQQLTINLMGLPVYFTRIFMRKAANKENPTSINRIQFNQLWKQL